MNLEAEKEAFRSEIKALEEDNSRWKGRTQQILAKYERIDPVEHQRLKDQVDNLKKEKDILADQLKSDLENSEALMKERDFLRGEVDGSKKRAMDAISELVRGSCGLETYCILLTTDFCSSIRKRRPVRERISFLAVIS